MARKGYPYGLGVRSVSTLQDTAQGAKRFRLYKPEAEFNLPPLRIKKESRAAKFKAIHGNDVIEADALPPGELRQRLEEHILAYLDREAWDKSVAIEKVEKQSIIDIVGKWKELNTQTDTSIT